ncbi:IpaD/SipD/SspD family type III secretion system needle tip protein [Acerihabitans sp.]|uniref:IpaD/SipD/SspD family type III secretion system needle tip protein n=1 Tax=Acerihabitans sp. TaxID=2811394 RepID=UPI002EDB1C14
MTESITTSRTLFAPLLATPTKAEVKSTDMPSTDMQYIFTSEGAENDIDGNNDRRAQHQTLEHVRRALDRLDGYQRLTLTHNTEVRDELERFIKQNDKVIEHNRAVLKNQKGDILLDSPTLKLPPAHSTEEAEVLKHGFKSEINGALSWKVLSAPTFNFFPDLSVVQQSFIDNYNTYNNGVQAYFNFYSAFSNFMNEMSKYLHTGEDKNGNQTLYYEQAVIDELNKMISHYATGSNGVLFPISGTATKAQAQRWAQEWGMSADCVQQLAGGGWGVRVDLTPLTEMAKGLKSALNDMNSFQFQAWQSGFDAQADKLKNTVQILMTKLTSEMGKQDNRLKELDAFLTSIKNMLLNILRSS